MNNYASLGMVLALCLVSACGDRQDTIETRSDDLAKKGHTDPSVTSPGKKKHVHGTPPGSESEDGELVYVSEAEALLPADERKTFQLPPGFEAQLFASEPDIGKPMNMAFDARGRLWVTTSAEYPYPAAPGEGRDRVTILEDSDGDGRADKFTEFANGLNIPIGVLPYKNGAIVYSIPEVYFLEDTDQDDIADKRTVLLDGFGFTDTHGMVNSLTRGFDGWVHADHGLNQSDVRGTDGKVVSMTYAATFKFQPDGTGVAMTTTGRANPYGLAFDPYGYLYSTDCHSKPIYQIIEGGIYPAFGKIETAFGFAPTMMRHTHGPTAIAGLAIYSGDSFPPEFQGNTFSGNVVSNRINRNELVYHGATPEALSKPDFLVSTDPWFRPVDMKVGLDGAMYVADFYNKIIGHYEVPLDHPDRDKKRGRIWRIVYTGEGKVTPGPGARDLTAASSDELIQAMADPNQVVRMGAGDQIVDRVGASAADALRAVVENLKAPAEQRVQALWALHRLAALPEDTLAAALTDGWTLVRVHATQVLGEKSSLSDRLVALLRRQLNDSDPHVRRAVLQAMTRHPETGDIRTTVEQLGVMAEHDTHLRYVAKLSLREQLRDERNLAQVLQQDWTAEESALLAPVMLGLESAGSAQFLWRHVQKFESNADLILRYLVHVTKYGQNSLQGEIKQFAESRFADSPADQIKIYQVLREGFALRSQSLTDGIERWGLTLAAHQLAKLPDSRADTWVEATLTPLYPFIVDSWTTAQIVPEGGGVPIDVVQGTRVGKILSPYFTAPARFSFRLFGAVGNGSAEGKPVSFARLRSVKTGEILAEIALRDKHEQRVQWDLSSHTGENVVFELEDGAPNDTSRNAFEMISAGAFEPPLIAPPPMAPQAMNEQVQFAASIAADPHAAEFAAQLAPELIDLLRKDWLAPESRLACAKALLAIDPQLHAGTLIQVFGELPKTSVLRQGLATLLGPINSPEAVRALLAALRDESLYRIPFAQALTESAAGKQGLLEAVQSGVLAPQLLQETAISVPLLRELDPQQQALYDQLVAQLEPLDVVRQKLIEQRIAAYSQGDASIEHGAELFQGFCSGCHQVNDRGTQIGPQLDGIGRWGSDRLMEKILDPSRTINGAFSTYDISLADGRFLKALYRREEGDAIIFANVGGEEFSVANSDILEMERSVTTLMPDNFGEIISRSDFDDLVTYLLSLR